MTLLTNPAGIRVARIRITAELLDLLREHRIFSGDHGRERFKAGDGLRVAEDARIEAYANLFEGTALPRRLGAFSYSYTSLNEYYSIGRYCSIAPTIRLMGSSHPSQWATTSPFSHFPHPVSSFRAYFKDRQVAHFELQEFDRGALEVAIGHDVWIGEAALLKRGVTIGNGAVIAARAVVTRDVPPYAIVGGIPAKIIRYRFSEAVIERLQRSEWWRFGPDQLQLLDVRDPGPFLDRLEQAVAEGLEPPKLLHLTGAVIIAAGEALS